MKDQEIRAALEDCQLVRKRQADKLKELRARNEELERQIAGEMPIVYLSRRNLRTLISKLDRNKNGDDSACTLIKCDNVHPKYPQTMKIIQVTAVEDEDYYSDRVAGIVDPADDEKLNKQQ